MPYDNWKLRGSDDYFLQEKIDDGIDSFESIFEDRVDSIVSLYESLKVSKNINKQAYDAIMAAIMDGIDFLRMEMDDLWNQDIAGSCHTDPPTENFELLENIIDDERQEDS